MGATLLRLPRPCLPVLPSSSPALTASRPPPGRQSGERLHAPGRSARRGWWPESRRPAGREQQQEGGRAAPASRQAAHTPKQQKRARGCAMRPGTRLVTRTAGRAGPASPLQSPAAIKQAPHHDGQRAQGEQACGLQVAKGAREGLAAHQAQRAAPLQHRQQHGAGDGLRRERSRVWQPMRGWQARRKPPLPAAAACLAAPRAHLHTHTHAHTRTHACASHAYTPARCPPPAPRRAPPTPAQR